MNKARRSLLLVALVGLLAACWDDYLTTEPRTILTDDVVWTDPNIIRGVIADFYGRLPQGQGFGGVQSRVGLDVTAYDEALWSGITSVGEEGTPNQILQYANDRWTLWDGDEDESSYGLIRDINLAIAAIGEASSPELDPVKAALLAELRFQRAWVYFEHVKRMGGVPILTEQQIYDFSGDPTYLQHPRDAEAAVYDFIAAEIDEIVGDLANAGSKTRANRYTALALKSRATLYAGSLARHNNEMSAPITLPGGEVGIPESRAADYYTQSLEASREILESGEYSLYQANPHLGENFYEMGVVKGGNPETIWIRDYSARDDNSHLWTMNAIPRSMRVDIDGSGISPTLQLVESYDYLDGSPGTLPGVGNGSNTAAGQADWIFYDEVTDIFEDVNGGKDARLYGAVVYPGTTVPPMNQVVRMQAGVYVWNAADGKYDRMEGQSNTQFTDSEGRTWVLTGADGPRVGESYMGNTGFLLRKFLDTNPAGATQATGSEVAWIFFRLGEIYLNAAEAAFELGFEAEALEYVNKIGRAHV